MKEIKQETIKDVSLVNEGKIHMSCVSRPLKWLNKKIVDSRYLGVQGNLCNTSRYPYLDISDL